MEEIKNDLLGDLKMTASNDALDLLASGENKYLKDFRLNFKSIIKPGALSAEEIALTGFALAQNAKNNTLKNYFLEMARELEIGDDKLSDAIGCASLLAANNVLYRFRHFVDGDHYDKSPAKLRMGLMMKSAIGKELFELISLAVSAVNGCEVCVSSHEKSLQALGVPQEKIWEAVRMATVITSADRIL